MKIVVFTLLVVAVTVHAAPQEDSSEKDKINECLQENDIKEEEFGELLEKDDPKLYCLLACIYEKEGILENGELNEDVLVKSIVHDLTNIKEETVYKAVKVCKEKVNDYTDVCDFTNQLTNCLKELMETEGETKN